MKYKNLPAEPVGWEPETSCNVIESDYEEDEDEDTDAEGEQLDTEIEASDQDSERSFRCGVIKKKLEKKSRKRDVVGIILQEDLFFFPEVY
jgi:hypothetical protein